MKFKVTQHELFEQDGYVPSSDPMEMVMCPDPLLSDAARDKCAEEMSKIRETHLLVECKIHSDGHLVTCVWIERSAVGDVPLGFKVI